MVIAEMELSKEQVEHIEERYREELVRDLFWHDFRGIVQVKKDVRLPLADIYQELALLKIGDDEERRQVHERLLGLDESERLREEERRLEERVSDVLVEVAAPGDPGRAGRREDALAALHRLDAGLWLWRGAPGPGGDLMSHCWCAWRIMPGL